MRRAFLAVLFAGGLLCSCAGTTEEDERLARHSQQEAWNRAFAAGVASVPAVLPAAAGSGPIGWIVGGVQLLGVGAAAYAAARKPGSKPPPPPPVTNGGVS